MSNHSPTDCTSFHHSPPPLLIPQQSVWGRDPTMLCNIILTVNFVRSGLFPTGHVSLTWEHRVFVPSAEGSPEKRRACHTHHWNLLSLWPHSWAPQGHSPSFCLQGSFCITTTTAPAPNTTHKRFTNHHAWAAPPVASKVPSSLVPGAPPAEKAPLQE